MDVRIKNPSNSMELPIFSAISLGYFERGVEILKRVTTMLPETFAEKWQNAQLLFNIFCVHAHANTAERYIKTIHNS